VALETDHLKVDSVAVVDRGCAAKNPVYFDYAATDFLGILLLHRRQGVFATLRRNPPALRYWDRPHALTSVILRVCPPKIFPRSLLVCPKVTRHETAMSAESLHRVGAYLDRRVGHRHSGRLSVKTSRGGGFIAWGCHFCGMTARSSLRAVCCVT
jgi:hypothetical protein